MSKHLEPLNDELFAPLTDDEQTALLGGRWMISGTVRLSGPTSIEFAIGLD